MFRSFFFSSRRRHARFDCDWSSDVCSSDLCLGARAVLLGRAYAFGLAAAGKAGVTRALEILRNDVERTLRLLGCPSVSALNSSYLNIPRHWQTSASNTR